MFVFFFYSAGNIIGHCIIDQKEAGFGFADPFYIHKTLKDLVLHYSQVSLAEHNDLLDVTLSFPVNSAQMGYNTKSYYVVM